MIKHQADESALMTSCRLATGTWSEWIYLDDGTTGFHPELMAQTIAVHAHHDL
jgi:hypothetical protein